MSQYFVYIIYSPDFNKFYRGSSQNPGERLKQHNNHESRYTKKFTPWKLVYVEALDNKSDALKREIKIKKYSHVQIEMLINAKRNVVQNWTD